MAKSKARGARGEVLVDDLKVDPYPPAGQGTTVAPAPAPAAAPAPTYGRQVGGLYDEWMTGPLPEGKVQVEGMPEGWYFENNSIYAPNGRYYAGGGMPAAGTPEADYLEKYAGPTTPTPSDPTRGQEEPAPAGGGTAPTGGGTTPTGGGTTPTTGGGAGTGNYNRAWVDDVMKRIASKAPNDVDWEAFGAANPDYMSQWNNDADPGVKAMKEAGLTFTDFAKFRYGNMIENGIAPPPVDEYNIYTIGAKKAAEEKAAADKAAAEQKTIDDAKAAAKASRNANIVGGRGKQLERANALLKSYGLDPAAYQDQLNSYFDSKQAALYENTDDPYAAFDPDDLISTITGQETSQRRQNYGNEVASKFGANYGNKIVSDSYLDPIIEEIIGEQQAGADTYLKRAADRGILNETGRTAAQNKIAADRAKGSAQLASLAGGVIDKYQTQGDEVSGKAQQGASGYTLGSNFNIGDYEEQGTNIINSAAKNARGDLLNALGGENFFDTSSLVNIGGAAQGATGLVDNTLAAAVAERKKRDSVSRGLGSQGAF